MKVLGLDSATGGCSAAIFINGEIVSSHFEFKTHGHSEALVPIVADVMRKALLRPADLDLITTTVGPGAFTGLRVGISTARGLALATQTPCKGVTTTEAIAQAVSVEIFKHAPVLVALNSRRSDLFVQVFGLKRVPLVKIRAILPRDLNDLIRETTNKKLIYITGDSAEVALKQLQEDGWETIILKGFEVPDARHVAALSNCRWRLGLPLLEAKPLYLRAPDAVLPQIGGRLRP